MLFKLSQKLTITSRRKWRFVGASLITCSVLALAWYIFSSTSSNRSIQPKTYSLPASVLARPTLQAAKSAAIPTTPVPSTIQPPLNTSAANSDKPMIGVFETASPSDPASLDRLDQIAQGGFNTVLNYTIWDGSISEISRYLDHAQALHLKIIFSLKDFYDNLPDQQVSLQDISQFGNSYDQVAMKLVSLFKNHPAVYGWYISDEHPETLAEAPIWLPIIKARYLQIKAIDPTHPILVVLPCYSGEFQQDSTSLGNLDITTDDLGLDTYPIPFDPIQTVGQCAQTLSQTVAQPQHRWSIIQSFSWKTYPDIVKSLGHDIGLARYPTKAELQSMVDQAKANGVPNLLFYSYADMKADSANFTRQWLNLTEVVKKIKG